VEYNHIGPDSKTATPFYLSISESSSESHNSDFEDQDQLFLPYDQDIEPLATEEESAAYAEKVAKDERQEREFKR
jgi:hypothetical protein